MTKRHYAAKHLYTASRAEHITLTVSRELKDELDTVAERCHMSASTFIRRCLQIPTPSVHSAKSSPAVHLHVWVTRFTSDELRRRAAEAGCSLSQLVTNLVSSALWDDGIPTQSDTAGRAEPQRTAHDTSPE